MNAQLNTETYKYQVSVIIPCYNTKLYLDECLQSLVDQTLKEIEIICINDGSTDGTGARLDEWQTKHPNKIKVIHQNNGGLANSRNAGMKIAQGECIGFVDSDDFVDICMYEKLYEALVDNNADVVQANVLKFNGADKIIKKQNKNYDIIQNNPIKVLLKSGYFGCDSVFRTSFLQKNQITYLPDIYFAEDVAFPIDIAFSKPKLFQLSNTFYYYRQNRLGQLTSLKSNVLYDIIKIFNYIENNHIKNCHNTAIKKYIIRKKLCHYMVLILIINRYYKQDFLFKCSNSMFNNNYKTIDIYKIILTTKYQKYINYLLGPISLLLLHCCYLWQKISIKKFKQYFTKS